MKAEKTVDSLNHTELPPRRASFRLAGILSRHAGLQPLADLYLFLNAS
jgi:hypothetical protein